MSTSQPPQPGAALPRALRFVVTEYKAVAKNTLVGTFTLRLDPIGLTIRECLFHRKQSDGGSHEWVAFPARPYTKDGKTEYAKILDWPDRDTWDRFQAAIVPRVKEFAAKYGTGKAPKVDM